MDPKGAVYDQGFCLRRYWSLRTAEPALFENVPGSPTQILLDAGEIGSAQRSVRVEREAWGTSTADLRVGVLAEDQYVGHVIRDAVRFSDGRYGLYNRVVTPGGVLVLPIIGNDIVLIRIFRHAPRRWFMEALQGLCPRGVDPVAQAHQELSEEIGATASELVPLGAVHTSTALTSETLDIYAARITAMGLPQRSEGIDSIHRVPNEQVDSAVRDGSICDGPTIAAILRARLHGLI
jgi:ADP-ribose pyrophosphatase